MTSQTPPKVDAAWLEPITTDKNMVSLEETRLGMPCLLSLLVMGISSCLCLMVIMLAGVMGYNDEFAAIQTDTSQTIVADANTQYLLMECDRTAGFTQLADNRATRISSTQAAYFEGDAQTFQFTLDTIEQTRIAEINRQYQQALQEESQGNWQMAVQRYLWISTAQPGCTDAILRLDEYQRRSSITPTETSVEAVNTPSANETPLVTSSPTVMEPPTSEFSPTPSRSPLEEYFYQADLAYDLRRYETAIEYLDIIILTDPTYRRSEVDKMLFEMLRDAATIYLRGQNADNEAVRVLAGNQLARGILFAERAILIQQSNPSVGQYPGGLSYEAGFAERYIQAKAYLDAGNYGAALEILEALGAENAGWGYRGTTVQSLLDRARSGN